MRSQVFSALVVLAVFSVSSKGSAAPKLECEGSGEEQVCMSLPPEAPESSVEAQAPVQEAAPLAMVTSTTSPELSGEAADYAVLPDLGLGASMPIAANGARIDPASAAAQLASERIQFVESFLRSSTNGNSIVTVSNDKKKH